jgi:hypothetical protein
MRPTQRRNPKMEMVSKQRYQMQRQYDTSPKRIFKEIGSISFENARLMASPIVDMLHEIIATVAFAV